MIRELEICAFATQISPQRRRLEKQFIYFKLLIDYGLQYIQTLDNLCHPTEMIFVCATKMIFAILYFRAMENFSSKLDRRMLKAHVLIYRDFCYESGSTDLGA